MNIDEIIEGAGDMTKPPSAVIPKKWFPELFSIFIKVLFLPFILFDLFCQRIAKLFVPPPFIKAGECKKRGNCCYYILIKKSWGVFSYLDLFWHTQINGFYRIKKEAVLVDGKKYYLMGCRYLSKEGMCKQYLLRPTICRLWPRIEIFGRPQILKGCGYFAKKRGSGPGKLNVLN